jgi:hypothetical protein
MNHIPGLDKYLTTEPEDSSLSYETYADEVVALLETEWHDEMENVLRSCYDNCVTIINAVKKLENLQSEEE